MKIIFALAVLVFFPCLTIASEATVWSISSRDDVLKGEAHGVSINDNGSVTLARRHTEVYKTGQAYVWSSVIDSSGNVFLGTGGEGRVFKVTPDGKGSLFVDLEGLNVSTMAIGRNGEIYAATSPDGKVYRLDESGTASIFFDPKEKYIWSLAVMNDGSLAVGTGENGKIYRVRSANATPESSVFYDTSETHIITLATDKAGNLYAGTDANGLVLKFGQDGRPFALLDSPLREIHDISVAADGSIYVLAISESISSAAPAAEPSPAAKTVSVEKPSPAAQPTPRKSRYDLSGAKSAVYRVRADGGNDIVWASASVVAFSVHARPEGGGVLIGTSDKGRIYSVGNDTRETLLVQTEAGQISGIRESNGRLYATGSNQGSLYRISNETIAEGIYESPVLDAKSAADWGRLWWRATGNVLIETRSGNTENANESWTAWQPVTGEKQSGPINSPPARFLQWRAVIRDATGRSVLNEVSVAYRARNIAPEVLSITVLPVNVGLIANPSVQIDPNIELSGMDPAHFGLQVMPVPPRRAYQRGAVSFQWVAEDRNSDNLIYDVFYKEVNDLSFKLLKSDLTDPFISVDGLALADGRYLLKIVAKDSPSNSTRSAMQGEMVSEPFDVDNTQPTVTVVGSPQTDGNRVRVNFLAEDQGRIVRAEYSINGGMWHPVYAEDGISDSSRETYALDITLSSPGEYSITLRVFDAVGNVGNGRAIVRR
ncbi:MAG: hypothetical protein KF685_13640 [Acidobacteria bacterium]|nr:hypothetical protein [Acidobacteriota bacterium]